jgi:tryptophanase
VPVEPIGDRAPIPRRTSTQSHIDYVTEVCQHFARRASELTCYRIVDEPSALRRLTVTFEPLG